MERELWPSLYHHLQRLAADFRQKYVSYQPWVLVACLLWAALHDRTRAWACDPDHWSTTALKPWRFPSPSVLSRRLGSAPVAAFLRELECRLRDAGELALLAILDGKPLPVSGVSRDRDATRGRGAGGKAKGYKLHTVWANRPMPEAWDVRPLNEAETAVAAELFGQCEGGGYVLADGNLDGNPVFDAAAAANWQLVVPMPHPNAGKGHHYQSPHRLRCIDLVRGEFGKALLHERGRIERRYGNAVSFAGGLAALPAWVRGLSRVRVWVWAKLLINAARIMRKQRLTARLQ